MSKALVVAKFRGPKRKLFIRGILPPTPSSNCVGREGEDVATNATKRFEYGYSRGDLALLHPLGGLIHSVLMQDHRVDFPLGVFHKSQLRIHGFQKKIRLCLGKDFEER